ncbi:GNAT family N-acetyltransferase [Clostridium butyricum]
MKRNKGESLRILKQFIIDSSDSLWAVELKNNNKVIGWVELHEYPNRINKNSKEIGCVLSEKYWGQGLMPEALKEVISYGFNEQRLKFIICSHFLNNNQSKRIIEKCGFNYVEVSNEKAYYCMLKNESRFT